MSLEILHPEPGGGGNENLLVDIVAVHGLGGDPAKTWTHSKTGAYWLKDFLPSDVPGARIFTFGYNANVVFGNSTANLRDHAKELLSSLIDERETEQESQRPMIFVAHSLGGIVVKEALLQARLEIQYNSIGNNTIGIVFLGTPHRGSDKANYGHVLTDIATSVLNKPPSRLVNALKENSDQLLQLTADFKHQLPMYQVLSVYELKPTKPLATLVVEKHSALLEVHGEDQIPADKNHGELCKFEARNDAVYRKIGKRINRMLKERDPQLPKTMKSATIQNKHYLVPHTVSPTFTGRRVICQKFKEACLPSFPVTAQAIQKRFVIVGLGGVGKTQVCLKLVQENREKFWGVFWLDASSDQTVDQGYEAIGRDCGILGDSKSIRQWLTNLRESWLLILDNADDPDKNISEYFPIGNHGTIIITTRNPQCQIHATVGSATLGGLAVDEAMTLLLKSAAIQNDSNENQHLAKTIVETLGCLALAIIQAGGYIRQNLCKLEEFSDIYSRQRQRLLAYQPFQADAGYKLTVYTTWEISIDKIKTIAEGSPSRIPKETARDALELLQILCFWHFDGISEEMFREAGKRSYRRNWFGELTKPRLLTVDDHGHWDAYPFRQAVALLSSFSLISIHGTDSLISIHPLVHTWARDRLADEERLSFWRVAVLTLGASCPSGKMASDYKLRRLRLPHINSCLKMYHSRELFTNDMQLQGVPVAERIAGIYYENGHYKESIEMGEQIVHIRETFLGNEDSYTLSARHNLALSYMNFPGQYQNALRLVEHVVEASTRTLGHEHENTLSSMHSLARTYRQFSRVQDAMRLHEQVLKTQKRILGDEHEHTLRSMHGLAMVYSELGRHDDALVLVQRVLDTRKRVSGDEHPLTLASMGLLAWIYYCLGRREDAIKLATLALETSKRVLEDGHPDTLRLARLLASYRSTVPERSCEFSRNDNHTEGNKNGMPGNQTGDR